MNLDLRLSVEDSPSRAALAIDLIRCARFAKDPGIAGLSARLRAPSAGINSLEYRMTKPIRSSSVLFPQIEGDHEPHTCRAFVIANSLNLGDARMPAKSKAQQQAAGIALAVKENEKPKSSLKGASKSMYGSMTEKELKKMASTSRKDKPEHKKKS